MGSNFSCESTVEIVIQCLIGLFNSTLLGLGIIYCGRKQLEHILQAEDILSLEIKTNPLLSSPLLMVVWSTGSRHSLLRGGDSSQRANTLLHRQIQDFKIVGVGTLTGAVEWLHSLNHNFPHPLQPGQKGAAARDFF